MRDPGPATADRERVMSVGTCPAQPAAVAVVVEEDVRTAPGRCPRPRARSRRHRRAIGVTGIGSRRRTSPVPASSSMHVARAARSPPRRSCRARPMLTAPRPTAAACRGARECRGVDPCRSARRVALITQTCRRATAISRGRKPTFSTVSPTRGTRRGAGRCLRGAFAIRPPPSSPRVARIATTAAGDEQSEQRARHARHASGERRRPCEPTTSSASRRAARAAPAPHRARRRRAPPSAPAAPRRPRRPRAARPRSPAEGWRSSGALASARCTT